MPEAHAIVAPHGPTRAPTTSALPCSKVDTRLGRSECVRQWCRRARLDAALMHPPVDLYARAHWQSYGQSATPIPCASRRRAACRQTMKQLAAKRRSRLLLHRLGVETQRQASAQPLDLLHAHSDRLFEQTPFGPLQAPTEGAFSPRPSATRPCVLRYILPFQAICTWFLRFSPPLTSNLNSPASASSPRVRSALQYPPTPRLPQLPGCRCRSPSPPQTSRAHAHPRRRDRRDRTARPSA